MLSNILSSGNILSLFLFIFMVVSCTNSNSASSNTAEATAPPPTPTPNEPPTFLETDDRGNMYYEMQIDNTKLQYAVTLPADFDSAKSYPILLALPPGAQNKAMVDVGLSGYWETEAKKRGWIVLSPVAPNGTLFFRGAESLIPEFLTRTATEYRPENDRYHIGGISNGGISSFKIALNNPELFKSITVLPGFPPTDGELNNLAALKDIPVAMFVGENDSVSWVERMQQTEQILIDLGGQVSFEVVPNEGHVIQGLRGGIQLFDLLESFR